ncbi:exonuclease domain-containing protein [Marixanthomonas ophiurae]|uniref:DNA polymerase III subunit epsilon n=1 Tax=Marixanthomonas ophiurae TaxID=387659 RepID=A0A3E1Q9I9_9FLAO|nr:exonuclease domain-containing protein [Marixanthomonas ophiurae]RFN58793.1 DNA polymerase III subunit epsilon [Marixanthomonas ophiurae]
MENKKFSIVDVETTGGGMRGNRITEICVVILQNGEILDKYTTLINPEKIIPHHITALTGISNETVEGAPLFYEVAEEIQKITENTIFVAHNVHFDYNVIRNEFRRLGMEFDRKKLCTVRLSRKLIPHLLSYSLGRICSSINIPIENRHRAEGDTDATVILFQRLMSLDENYEVFNQFLNPRSKEASLPPHLNSKQILDLPNSAGIYLFKNKGQKVIYVGKAKNIKKRVLSHIYNKKNKGYLMCQESFFIEHEETGNELTALLLESELIKKYYPKFNRAQKRPQSSYKIISYKNQRNIIQLAITKTKATDDSLMTFYNRTLARERLEYICETYNLCPRYCGLQSNVEVCSHYKINNCEGICDGTEEIEDYNKKVGAAIEHLNDDKPTYIIYGNGRNSDEKSIVLIKEGRYRGFGFVDESEGFSNVEEIENFLSPMHHTYHTSQIIRSYLKKNPYKNVVQFEKEVLSE